MVNKTPQAPKVIAHIRHDRHGHPYAAMRSAYDEQGDGLKEGAELVLASSALASLRAAQEGDLPPLPEHWIPVTFVGLSPLAIARAHEYAEIYARLALAAAGGGVPQGWISLEQQRPEPEVFVLAWDGKKVAVDWWGSLYRPHGTEYTHWMPFPAPPGVSGRSMYGMHSLTSSPQPEAAQEQPEKCGNRDYCGRFPFCGCGGPEPLPERDTSKPAEQQGLFRKFDVRRTDGSDKPGGKHYGCEYFVLDVAHDKHAKAALAAYAAAVEETHPHLAQDMRDRYELSTPAQPEAAPAVAQVPEAAEQVEFLDAQNHQLRRAIHAAMSRLSALLDEDQFAEMEQIFTRAGVAAPEAPAQADDGKVVVTWNHDRTRILAVTRQNTEGQILKVIAETPAQAAQSAGEVERRDVVAFEFYNPATGHAIVDYSVNTHVGTLSADRGYEARPLVYAQQREAVTDGSKPIPLWQAREALDELEASARGDAPFNHHAAAVVRAALESAEQPRQMVALTEAARDVLAERQRQISAEAKYGDAEHENGELAIAAACYALIAERGLQVATLQIPKLWEWTGWRIEGFKPRDKRRNLVKAGALILAEIERLDRASGIPAPGGKE